MALDETCSKVKTVCEPEVEWPVEMALIKAVRGCGTVIDAEYGILTAGVSWHGTAERQWMAWNWLNRYGCCLPSV